MHSVSFVPWRDECLLPEESCYALISKWTWFQARPPTGVVRACRLPREGVKPAGPIRVDFNGPNQWHDYLENPAMMPSIHGFSLVEHLRSLDKQTKEDIGRRWLSHELRVCDHCIGVGVHLRLHQHLAVARCPVHDTPLRAHCRDCGKPLEHAYAKGQMAFACAACERSLLVNGNIAVDHSIDFRTLLAEVAQQAVAWLMPINLGGCLACGVGALDRDAESLLGLTRPHMMLEAVCRTAQPPPTWVERQELPDVSMTLRRLDVRCQPSVSISAGSVDVLRILPDEWSHDRELYESAEGLPLRAGRFRQAVQRVAARFIRQLGAQHSECLDTPFRMFGAGLKEYETHPFELLDCCPVATGFWLWRIACHRMYVSWAENDRSSRFHRQLPAGTFPRNADLLLYVLAKSQLHYFIYVARQCQQAYWGTEAENWGPMMQPLFELAQCWDDTWSSYRDSGNQWPTVGDGVHYLQFNADALIQDMACPGALPYQARLRRQLRSAAVRSPDGWKIVNREASWASRQFAQQRPFAPMKGDWIFHPTHRGPGRSWRTDFD